MGLLLHNGKLRSAVLRRAGAKQARRTSLVTLRQEGPPRVERGRAAVRGKPAILASLQRRFQDVGARGGFTLIELLVVTAIIALLIAILIPALSRARTQGKSALCLTRLRTLGQGIVLYANDNADSLMPARLPKIDDKRWRTRIAGGVKYRPTFLTLMGGQLGIPPFSQPAATVNEVDDEGQPGDRQNYSNEAYLCPEVSEWVDERNGAYGYNYHFLGNARLRDPARLTSYKNWPVKSASVRSPAACVAVADGTGTAASFPRHERRDYEDNEFGDSQSGRSLNAWGNEGFNLDPPRVDAERGEMAGFEEGARTAVHERHGRRGNVLWLDGHGSAETLRSLGYKESEDGVVGKEGRNRFFNADGSDEAWIDRQAF